MEGISYPKISENLLTPIGIEKTEKELLQEERHKYIKELQYCAKKEMFYSCIEIAKFIIELGKQISEL